MNLNQTLKKQNGFTLIEILASIIILSIILITFFSFFSQSINFSKANEEEYAAIHLAEQIWVNLNKSVDNSPSNPNFKQNLNLTTYNTAQQNALNVDQNGFIDIDGNGIINEMDQYKLNLVIQLESNFTNFDIYFVNIRIVDKNNHVLTETYGYLKGF